MILRDPQFIARAVTLLLKEVEPTTRRAYIQETFLINMTECSATFSVKGLMALLLPFVIDQDEYDASFPSDISRTIAESLLA